MDQMNLKQKDIAPLFGGETRAPEVLKGKCQLTLKMIVMLNHYLDIPLESLISGNKTYKLESFCKIIPGSTIAPAEICSVPPSGPGESCVRL